MISFSYRTRICPLSRKAPGQTRCYLRWKVAHYSLRFGVYNQPFDILPVVDGCVVSHFIPSAILGKNLHTITCNSSTVILSYLLNFLLCQVEEALEEVLPEECRSLDAYALEPSPAPRRIMLNSEDPLLSSSPRDFSHQRPMRRFQRMVSIIPMHQWQQDTSLQVIGTYYLRMYLSFLIKNLK